MANNRLSPCECVYISQLHKLKGLRRPRYIRVGTYFKRSDSFDITLELCLMRAIDVTSEYKVR